MLNNRSVFANLLVKKSSFFSNASIELKIMFQDKRRRLNRMLHLRIMSSEEILMLSAFCMQQVGVHVNEGVNLEFSSVLLGSFEVLQHSKLFRDPSSRESLRSLRYVKR